MVELIVTELERDEHGNDVLVEQVRCWVWKKEIYLIVGHRYWAERLAATRVFDLATRKSLSLEKHGEEWALSLPQAFRTGQTLCHARPADDIPGPEIPGGSGDVPAHELLKLSREEIAVLPGDARCNLKDLRRLHAQYADAEAFSTEWVKSDDHEAANRIAAIERFYQRIVDSVVDMIELVEGMPVEDLDPYPIAERDRSYRWSRLAAYGLVTAEIASSMEELSAVREKLSLNYVDEDFDEGRALYEAAGRLLAIVPELIETLESWAVAELGRCGL